MPPAPTSARRRAPRARVRAAAAGAGSRGRAAPVCAPRHRSSSRAAEPASRGAWRRPADRWARHCDNPVHSGAPTHPMVRRSGRPGTARPDGLDLRPALPRRAPGGRRTGRGPASGDRLRRRNARPARGARVTDRRARRGLSLLRAHGPARAARRHRAAAAAAGAVAGDHAARHAPAHARGASARPAREPLDGHRDLARGHVPLAHPDPLRRGRRASAAAHGRAPLVLRRRRGALVAAGPAGPDAQGSHRDAADRLHRALQGRARRARAVPGMELHRPLPLVRAHAADLGPQPGRGPERGGRDHDGRAVADAGDRPGLAVHADADALRAGGAAARAAGGGGRRPNCSTRRTARPSPPAPPRPESTPAPRPARARGRPRPPRSARRPRPPAPPRRAARERRPGSARRSRAAA